jgi:hypothetical protein
VRAIIAVIGFLSGVGIANFVIWPDRTEDWPDFTEKHEIRASHWSIWTTHEIVEVTYRGKKHVFLEVNYGREKKPIALAKIGEFEIEPEPTTSTAEHVEGKGQ